MINDDIHSSPFSIGLGENSLVGRSRIESEIQRVTKPSEALVGWGANRSSVYRQVGQLDFQGRD